MNLSETRTEVEITFANMLRVKCTLRVDIHREVVGIIGDLADVLGLFFDVW